jgi:hypothetical protein
MNPNDAEEYTQSLGQIIGGSWRPVALAQRLGVPKALGLTTEQWVNERLGGYVKLARDDRREAVKELKAEGHSNVEIGKVLGVAEGTVRNDMASADSQNCEADEASATFVNTIGIVRVSRWSAAVTEVECATITSG